MLAGEPPFTGATTQAMLRRRLTEAPRRARRPGRTCRRGGPGDGRALAPVAADRFGTIGAVGPRRCRPQRPSRLASAQRPRSAAAPTSSARRGVAAGAPGRAAFPLAAAAMVLGLLHRRWACSSPGGARPPGAPRPAATSVIAVLPFQNLGDSADAYFADGMTDAVRGKLDGAAEHAGDRLGQLGQYKGTTKTPGRSDGSWGWTTC